MNGQQAKGGMMPKRILSLGLIGSLSCLGCSTSPSDRAAAPAAPQPNFVPVVAAADSELIEAPLEVLPVSHESSDTAEALSLVDYILNEALEPASNSDLPASVFAATVAEQQSAAENAAGEQETFSEPLAASTTQTIELNLPSTLAMVGGQHPAVGIARWRVREAYARLTQAKALWLPSIQAGFSFHRHDGNYQASNGDIVDVNRNSFQYGLGVAATGAGTTPRPGLVAQFHLADAIFQPRVAQTTAWAHGHAAGATLNRQLLSAAIAYNDLVAAYQDRSILEESKSRTSELAKLTKDFAEAGQGLQADADRMQTELALMENRLLSAEEEIGVASARLAQAVSLDGYGPIMPLDATVLPLEMSSPEQEVASLIGTGLAMRPELKESQALVAAACEAYQREKYAPFVPSVLLGFSTGGFGGGLGNNLDDIDGRYDFDALMSWQVRNLGQGEKAARRGQSARVQQAKFQRVRVMDQVAREVSESYARVQSRRRQIETTEQAIRFAESSYDRNLKRIRDGEGLPLEVLQSLQALEQAQRAYLRAVVDHNQAQFELQWAQGWPIQG